MARIPRQDPPGSWHHVYNRAIARRTLFERREDYRFFLASLARAVRRSEIEVHAYSLMGTHYHLLLRSPAGRLSAAMQRIQLAYSRSVTEQRRRDGSLVRGRYGSRLVRSLLYRRHLVRNIDFNPCSAGLVGRPANHPWGSACHDAKPAGPAWLERSWVESVVAHDGGFDRYRPQLYDQAFPARNAAELTQLVEARLEHNGDQDFLDDIVGAADASTRAWMVRKALLADGTRPGLPLLPLARLQRIVESRRARPWIVKRGKSERGGWSFAYIGLGRDFSGATVDRLANDLSISATNARRIYAFHRAELNEHGFTLELSSSWHAKESRTWPRPKRTPHRLAVVCGDEPGSGTTGRSLIHRPTESGFRIKTWSGSVERWRAR